MHTFTSLSVSWSLDSVKLLFIKRDIALVETLESDGLNGHVEEIPII